MHFILAHVACFPRGPHPAVRMYSSLLPPFFSLGDKGTLCVTRSHQEVGRPVRARFRHQKKKKDRSDPHPIIVCPRDVMDVL